MPALGLKLRINRITARIWSVITTNLLLWQKMILLPYTGGARLLDASGTGNNGTAYTGRTMSFDGVNDVITIGSTGQSVRTVVMWVYPNTTTQSFCQLTTSGGVDVKITSGTLSGSGWTSPSYYVNGAAGTTVAASTWQMIVITSATAVTASDVRLGLDNATYYSGRLANVIFYSTQLTAVQIAELYAYPEKPTPTGVTIGSIVGWWPLAEGVAAGIAIDGSGNNNNGTINGPSDAMAQDGAVPQWAFKGNSWPMCFDGSNDNVSCGNTGISVKSLVIWLINKTNTEQFLQLQSSGAVDLGISSGTLSGTGWTSPSYYVNGAASTTVAENKITFVCVTSSTSVSASDFKIGLDNASYFKGAIFKIGLYDSQLTSNEISALYAAGINHDLRISAGNYTSAANLKGYWVNTGNQNSDWLDLSGNGKNGTVNGSPERLFLPEGTASGNDLVGMSLGNPNSGAMFMPNSGKLSIENSSSINSMNSAYTVEFWLKPIIISGQTYIIDRTNFSVILEPGSSPNTNRLRIRHFVAPSILSYYSSANFYTPDGSWIYVSVTFNGTNVAFYKNGSFSSSTAATGPLDTVSTVLFINYNDGNSTAIMDEGYIDDLRIYNQALTAAQILNNYKATKAAHS